MTIQLNSYLYVEPVNIFLNFNTSFEHWRTFNLADHQSWNIYPEYIIHQFDSAILTCCIIYRHMDFCYLERNPLYSSAWLGDPFILPNELYIARVRHITMAVRYTTGILI